jgi:hypothetical protein
VGSITAKELQQLRAPLVQKMDRGTRMLAKNTASEFVDNNVSQLWMIKEPA